MVACNRGKIMQKCKKMMALIMVFALCLGFLLAAEAAAIIMIL